MSQIKNYTAQLADAPIGGGRASPDAFGAGTGAGLMQLAKGAEQYYSHVEEEESRAALVGSSQIRAKYAKALDEATISGGDVTDLKTKMADELSAIGENFRTKKGQDSLALHTANTSIMFDEQANRIAVQRASSAARLQGKTFLDSESATIMSNPLYLGMAEKNAEAFAATLPGVSPEAKAKMASDLRSEMNMTAAVASARIAPEDTMKQLENGKWALSPEQRLHAMREAKTQMNAVRADEIHRREEADYQIRKAEGEASDMLLQKILDGSITDGEIAHNPDLRTGSRENLIHFQAWRADKLLERANKPHPADLMNLWLDVHAPKDDPRKIYNANPVFEAALAGKLNPGEAETALRWVSQQKDENYNAFSSRLRDKMMTIQRTMMANPVWQAQGELAGMIQMEIKNRAEERASQLRSSGTRGQDPNQILDPTSKEYMFSPGLVNSVAQDLRSAGMNLVLRAPVKFPDGITRVWNGKEPKTDMNNWAPTEEVLPKTAVSGVIKR